VQDGTAASHWIREAKKGDEQAFERLVEAYYRPLFRLVFQMVPNRQDTEDILQDTYFRFFKALKRVDPEGDPFPFLRTIAVRRTYSFLSRDRRAEVALDDLPEDLPQLTVVGHACEVKTLYRWVQALPPAQRLVFLLREVLGVQDAEISKMMGIREVTVRRHASLARQALEKGFGGG
jgi:RNA polymerase sigma-70 factor (ECF subfamily)